MRRIVPRRAPQRVGGGNKGPTHLTGQRTVKKVEIAGQNLFYDIATQHYCWKGGKVVTLEELGGRHLKKRYGGTIRVKW